MKFGVRAWIVNRGAIRGAVGLGVRSWIVNRGTIRVKEKKWVAVLINAAGFSPTVVKNYTSLPAKLYSVCSQYVE